VESRPSAHLHGKRVNLGTKRDETGLKLSVERSPEGNGINFVRATENPARRGDRRRADFADHKYVMQIGPGSKRLSGILRDGALRSQAEGSKIELHKPRVGTKHRR